jgi:hypothetical protein
MPREERTAGFAIVRVDDFFDEPLTASNIEDRITIKKVVATKEADAEVARLNGIAQERVRYFAQHTRLVLADWTA